MIISFQKQPPSLKNWSCKLISLKKEVERRIETWFRWMGRDYILSPIQKFRAQFFEVIDSIRTDIRGKYSAIKEINSYFSFLQEAELVKIWDDELGKGWFSTFCFCSSYQSSRRWFAIAGVYIFHSSRCVYFILKLHNPFILGMASIDARFEFEIQNYEL